MTNSELRDRFFEVHNAYIKYIDSLNEAEFMYAPSNEKWSAGQQLEHIARSIGPLKKAFTVPNMVLKLKFGKANRPSRSYDETVAVYHSKLAAGYDISGSSFSPDKVPFEKKQEILDRMKSAMDKLTKSFAKYSEKDLDTILLPHPLIGKMTLRELFYFTNYHVTHHHKSVEENLKARV